MLNNNFLLQLIRNDVSGSRKKKEPGRIGTIGFSKIYINHIYPIAVAVSLAFSFLGIGFILIAGHLSKIDTVENIQTATEQIKFAIEEYVGKEFETLMTAAILVKKNGVPAEDNTDKLTDRLIMASFANYNAFVRVGISDNAGKAIWIDKGGIKHREMSDEPFIISALSGKQVITETKKNAVNGMDVNFFAVPIIESGKNNVYGVFFAANPEDELRRITEHSMYVGKGICHIVDANGNFIVKSNSPLVLAQGNNIFNLKIPLDEVTEHSIRSDFQAGRRNYLEITFSGEKRMIAYLPLNINNWFVFYAAPENLVSTGANNITKGAIIIICSAVLIFIFLISLIHRINNTSRKALETVAFTDPLTGKHNYQKFLLDAKEVLSKSRGVHYAVCYSDIKGFKYINDFFGRDVGDRLLQYWSDFQYEITQSGEVCGHVYGDIFVSLRKYHSKQEIETRFESTARRLMVYPETFSQGYKAELFGGAYLISESEGNLELSDMLDRAITAQKEVKNAGGTKRLGIYTEEMRKQKLWETEVESRMESALENGEFKIYLQPKFDIQHDNSIIGAEALVRWESPEKGLIPPCRFIHLFEQNGFIIKLDRFIFETICKWYRVDVLDNDVPRYILSVNVSRLGLMQPDFIRTYMTIKDLNAIPDGCIELEFTESLVFGNHKLFQSIVSDCRQNGFLCSMDDFGSGYSSLNLLKSIHMDVLKLDGLFFKPCEDTERGQKLVKNIIAMANSLDMKTVAEGIETVDQVTQLREIGCNAVQGYVFSKPMPIGDFCQFFRQWNRNARPRER